MSAVFFKKCINIDCKDNDARAMNAQENVSFVYVCDCLLCVWGYLVPELQAKTVIVKYMYGCMYGYTCTYIKTKWLAMHQTGNGVDNKELSTV